jgi:hypothetical protein
MAPVNKEDMFSVDVSVLYRLFVIKFKLSSRYYVP